MTSDIFTFIVKDLDKKLNSPAVLILDNFSGHNIDEFDNLNFILPIFLPPNTTSKTPPLDAGIVSIFKFKYRQLLLKYSCDNVLLRNFKVNDISIRLILPWIKESFYSISEKTIQKCFHKTIALDIFAVQDESFNIELASLKQAAEKYLGETINSENLLQYALTDEVKMSSDDDNDDEDNEIIVVEDQKKLLSGLEAYKIYFSNTGCYEELKYIKKLEETLKKHLEFQ